MPTEYILGGHLTVQNIGHRCIGFDNILLAIAAGGICGGFCYFGYLAELYVLFIPTGIVTLVCFVSVLFSLYVVICDWRAKKPTADKDHKTP
ncbi:MAG: hypothetical protein ACI8WB_005383 [Phenylobacterium sp.]